MQSVVTGITLDNSGRIVRIYIATQCHLVAVEIRIDGSCCLVAVGSHYNIHGSRDIGTLYAVIVVDIAFLVHLQFLTNDASFKRYTTQAIGRIYVAVVKGGLYHSLPVINLHKIGACRDKTCDTVVECNV